MTKIKFSFVDVQGNPLANMEFKLLLKRASFNEDDIGVVLPEEISVTTDTDGTAIVELWPLKTAYRIRIAEEYEELCGKLNWQFYVPETTSIVDAQTLFLVPPPRNIPWDEEAIGKINQAVIDAKDAQHGAELAETGATTQADRAKSEADRAEVAAGGIGNAVQEAKDAARASEASAVRSEDQVALAAAQVVLAADQVGMAKAEVTKAKGQVQLATDQALLAGQAAVVAGNARDGAVTAKGQADQAATAAHNSQLVAKDSQTQVAADAAQVAADRVAISGMASQVSADAVQVASDKNKVAQNTAEAKTARDEAVAAAGALTGALVESGPVDLSSGVYPPKPTHAAIWQVTVGGTVNGVIYRPGDSLIYSLTQDLFYKQNNSGAVQSVNGQTGTVVISKSDVGLGNVDNTSDADKPLSQAGVNALSGKEPTITPGTNAQYLNGLKAWADLSTAVRTTLLTGLAAGGDTPILAGDTLIQALGKLQTQVSGKLKVGDYGIGASGIPAAADCNLIALGGMYTINPSTLNKPAAGSFTLLHQPHEALGTWTQLAIGTGTGSAMYVRGCLSSTIGPWTRLLKVGDCGLAASTGIPTITDCDLALTQGVYAIAAGTINAPRSDVYGTLEVSIYAAGYGCHVITSTRGHNFGEKRWLRTFNPSGFTGWFELAKVGDYGMGSAAVPFVTDLNQSLIEGSYKMNGDTLNGPGIMNAVVEIVPYDSVNVMQRVTRFQANGEIQQFTRISSSGSWKPWVSHANSSTGYSGSLAQRANFNFNSPPQSNCQFWADSTSTNGPGAGDWLVSQLFIDTNAITQHAVSLQTGTVHTRTRTVSVGWSAWAQAGGGNKVKPDGFPFQTSGATYLLINGVVWAACGTNANITNIAAARGTAGSTRAYGFNNFNRVPIQSFSKVKKVVGNGVFMFALLEDTGLLFWGSGANGMGGLGTTTDIGVPVLSTTNVIDIYYEPSNAGVNSDAAKAIIRKSDGLYACGYNGYGQLGTGDTVNKTVWTKIWHDGPVKDPAVAAWGDLDTVWNLGATYGCIFVRSKDNRLFATGFNSIGQLGDGTVTQRNGFVDVTANWGGTTEVAKIIKMSGGYGYADASAYSTGGTYAQLPDGYRYSGANGHGQAGIGSTSTQITTPIKVTMPEAAKEFCVSGGGITSCYWVGVSGKLYVWGRNIEQMLGTGNASNVTTPTISPWFDGTTQEKSVDTILNKGGFNRQGYSYAGMMFYRAMNKTVWHVGLSGTYESGAMSALASAMPKQVFLPYLDSNNVPATYNQVTILDTGPNGSGGCSIAAHNTAGDMYVWGSNANYGAAWLADGSPIQIPLSVKPAWQ